MDFNLTDDETFDLWDTVYGKTFEGENFRGFQPIAKVFPLNHLLCTVHNAMGLMHRESFPVNGMFCAKPRKFSPSKVLPYTVIARVYKLLIIACNLDFTCWLYCIGCVLLFLTFCICILIH